MANRNIDEVLEELIKSVQGLDKSVGVNTKELEKVGHYQKQREDLLSKLDDQIGIVAKTMPMLISVGKEQSLTNNTLIRAYKDTGLSLKEALEGFSISIATGFKHFEGASSELIATYVRLGLNEADLIDMLAVNTEVLRTGVDESNLLGERILHFARTYHVDTSLLINSIRDLDKINRVIAVQGGNVTGFQTAVAAMQGALGPTFAEALPDLIAKISGTSIESFARSFILGGKPLVRAGMTPGDIVDSLGETLNKTLELANSMGVTEESLPFMADVFQRVFNITPEMLQLAKIFPSQMDKIKKDMNDMLDKQEADSRRYDFYRALNQLIMNIQSITMPLLTRVTEFIGTNSQRLLGIVENTVNDILAWYDSTDVYSKLDEWLSRGTIAFDSLIDWVEDLRNLDFYGIAQNIKDIVTTNPLDYVNPFATTPGQERRWNLEDDSKKFSPDAVMSGGYSRTDITNLLESQRKALESLQAEYEKSRQTKSTSDDLNKYQLQELGELRRSVLNLTIAIEGLEAATMDNKKSLDSNTSTRNESNQTQTFNVDIGGI